MERGARGASGGAQCALEYNPLGVLAARGRAARHQLEGQAAPGNRPARRPRRRYALSLFTLTQTLYLLNSDATRFRCTRITIQTLYSRNYLANDYVGNGYAMPHLSATKLVQDKPLLWGNDRVNGPNLTHYTYSHCIITVLIILNSWAKEISG